MTLSNQSHFPRFFSPRKMTYRDLANSGLWQAGIACPRKMTLGSWRHQTLFQIWQDDFPGPGRFRLVVSWNWPVPGKSFSVISPFWVSKQAALICFMLLSWDCIIKIFYLNLPGTYYLTSDRMSLVSPPSSNGWNILLNNFSWKWLWSILELSENEKTLSFIFQMHN